MKTDEFSAIGVGRDLPISDKRAREVLHYIKGKDIDKAIKTLERVMKFKELIPFKRRKHKIGHKPGMAAGRYPIVTCDYIIKVLKNAKNNAINKGLQESKLFIKNAAIAMGISKTHRVRSKKGPFVHSAKATQVYITLAEREEEKAERKAPKKTEVKEKEVKEQPKKESLKKEEKKK